MVEEKETVILTLFVTGKTPRSESAIENLREICDDDPDRVYDLRIVDVLEDPEAAEENKILATPTVVKELPLPIRRIVGDLSDREKVLVGLSVARA